MSEEEAKNAVKEFQTSAYKQWVTQLPLHPECSTTRIEYYLAKGMSEEEARLALKERQTTFSLDVCIEKYGEEEGIKRWQERQNKWQSSLQNKPSEEIESINKSKNAYINFIKEDVERDDDFFARWKEICIKRNLVYIDNNEELEKYIVNLIQTDEYLKYKGIDYFINKACPQYLYKVLKYPVEKIINLIKPYIVYDAEIYKCGSSSYPSYHMVVDEGILLSLNEIIFYKKLKDKGITNIKINDLYPNSNMKYDFYINGKYIEICGLMDKDNYREKVIYKRDTFGSFLLTNVKEYDNFIQKVIMENDNDTIEYYNKKIV